ncbi:hypothetical protein AS4_29290 [Acinetobacter guillouiae]|uniref:hypothetical protein n=1 Tax=Acinetobacter guillouiae TaxID=106649 RepID=UPI0004EF60AB|nr:hypothetical protein [Acinetobacter guillouiae]BAP37869.1 hypothetical protein AS4_29290 [Acinetobacter guillouiae]
MTGLDPKQVNEAFFKDNDYSINIIIHIGYGEHSKIYVRLPRLAVEDAYKIL